MHVLVCSCTLGGVFADVCVCTDKCLCGHRKFSYACVHVWVVARRSKSPRSLNYSLGWEGGL